MDIEAMLSDTEIERYASQIRLHEIGGLGQRRLKESHVFVVGAGGLGCPLLTYLAAAGVGKIAFTDPDDVSLSNLNRQFTYSPFDINHLKAGKMAHQLRDLNSDIHVRPYAERITPSNAAAILTNSLGDNILEKPLYDLVVDCSDNFETRMLVNETCMRFGIPLLSTAAAAWSGQVALYRGKPCMCCWAEPPRQPDPCGVLGAMTGMVGTMAAAEAVKFLVGAETPSLGRLLVLNGLTMETTRIDIPADPECPHCGGK